MKQLLKILADLRFAISLLILICFIIFIGSVIEQDQTLEFYKQNYLLEKPIFYFITWKFIIFFQLDHIYKTIWFSFILFILGISLITCSFIQQLPNFKTSRQCIFYKQNQIDFQKIISKENIGKFFKRMKNFGYLIFQKKLNFYATKGITGKIAPVFVHLSLILILFGSILDSISNFNAQELITKAEIFHVQNITRSGFFTSFFQQPLRVNDFWINYYNDNKIKQFYSNISVLSESGKEIINKTVSVNNPLFYKNIVIYQTDWVLVGLRIKEKTNYFQIPLIPIDGKLKKLWLTWLPINDFNNQNNYSFGKTIILKDYKENFYIYDLNGVLIKIIDTNEFVLEKNYKIIDLLSSTGLQIKSNQGIIYIYIGFGFLMINTFLSYISFSQIWGIVNIGKNDKDLNIFAKTNRNKFALNIEIFKLTKNF
jgi:cytochrome c biogenesis protein